MQRSESEVRQYGLSVELFFFDLSDKNSFTAQTTDILQAAIEGVILAPMFVEETKAVVAE